MLASYRELTVWKKSIALVTEIYRLTFLFPKEELYGLTSQMRRAAVSIPANIAEGYGRGHRQEYIRFLWIAFASATELETHLIISQKLGFAKNNEYWSSEELLTEIMKMLRGLIRTLIPKPSPLNPNP